MKAAIDWKELWTESLPLPPHCNHRRNPSYTNVQLTIFLILRSVLIWSRNTHCHISASSFPWTSLSSCTEVPHPRFLSKSFLMSSSLASLVSGLWITSDRAPCSALCSGTEVRLFFCSNLHKHFCNVLISWSMALRLETTWDVLCDRSGWIVTSSGKISRSLCRIK